MTVTEIVTRYLKRHGYDGLAGDGCGCGLGDLAPCCDNITDCTPGYAADCTCGERCDDLGYHTKKLTCKEVDDA